MDGIVYQIYESVNLHLRQSIHSSNLLLILLHIPVSHFMKEVHLWTFCINNLCLIDAICRQHILFINTQTQQRVNKCCTHNQRGYTKFQTVAFFHALLSTMISQKRSQIHFLLPSFACSPLSSKCRQHFYSCCWLVEGLLNSWKSYSLPLGLSPTNNIQNWLKNG